jgi:AcrR family transcriptional regulator
MPAAPDSPAESAVATPRARLVEAALELFTRQGFEATTVDEIAAHAGVGRTTFFRLFATKEAVVFPDHASIQAALDARLAVASTGTSEVALLEGAMIVLDHYLAEGSIARARYALTSTIPILRAAEVSSQRSYERIFRTHARAWGHEELDAELLASGVVTAHNHVLRRWLRERTDDPRGELRVAVGRAVQAGGGSDTHVVVLSTDLSPAEVTERVRTALSG